MMLMHTLPRHHYHDAPKHFNPDDNNNNNDDDDAAVQLTSSPVEEVVSFTYEELNKYDGTYDDSKPILVAIKGTVFDVSRNVAYRPGGAYHGMWFVAQVTPDTPPLTNTDIYLGGGSIYVIVCLETLPANADNDIGTVYAGKDPSRALALSSRNPEDCVPEWFDLEYKYKTVLDEWYAYFQKRYDVVGTVKSELFRLVRDRQ